MNLYVYSYFFFSITSHIFFKYFKFLINSILTLNQAHKILCEMWFTMEDVIYNFFFFWIYHILASILKYFKISSIIIFNKSDMESEVRTCVVCDLNVIFISYIHFFFWPNWNFLLMIKHYRGLIKNPCWPTRKKSAPTYIWVYKRVDLYNH